MFVCLFVLVLVLVFGLWDRASLYNLSWQFVKCLYITSSHADDAEKCDINVNQCPYKLMKGNEVVITEW